MQKTLLAIIFFVFTRTAFSQDLAKFKLYKPEENAATAIDAAVKEAKATGKNVLIQVGGNWCIWCARFNDFVTTDPSLDSLMNANYVIYHLNYSKENKNKELLTKYQFPQRFGYPVFLILDGRGNLIHTQNTGYLEDGVKSYDKSKVAGFFKDWGPKAFDPSQYAEK